MYSHSYYDSFDALVVIFLVCLIFGVSYAVIETSEISDEKYALVLDWSTDSSVLELIESAMSDDKITQSEFFDIKARHNHLTSNKLALETAIQGGK